MAKKSKAKDTRIEIEIVESQQIEIKNIQEVERYLPVFTTLENDTWQPGDKFYDDPAQIVEKYASNGLISRLRIMSVRLPVEVIPARIDVG